MSDQQPERYQELDIGVLRDVVAIFLRPYPFIHTAYLYPGKESRYAIVFEVPAGGETHHAYNDFRRAMGTLPRYSVDLKRVYRTRTSGVDDRPDNEWRLYDIPDIRDIEFEPLGDFVNIYDRVHVYGPGLIDNSPHIFPGLRFHVLQSFALQWVDLWPVIQRIRLFHYSPSHQWYPALRNSTIRYALVFDLVDEDYALKTFWHTNGTRSEPDLQTFWHVTNQRLDVREDLNNFSAATNYYQVPDGFFEGIFYEQFMPGAFKDVYEQRPPDDYQKEWILVPLRQGEEPVCVDNKVAWLLFDRYADPSSVSPVTDVSQEELIKQLKKDMESTVKQAIKESLPSFTQDTEFSLIPQNLISNGDIMSDLLESDDLPLINANYVFKRYGDMWLIKFGEENTTIKYKNGLHYIAYLLSSPGKTFDTDELYALVNQVPHVAEDTHIDKVDSRALREFRDQASDILGRKEIAIEMDNENEIDKLSEQLDDFRKTLLKEYSIRLWVTDDGTIQLKPYARISNKKVQDSVTKAITRAYDALGKNKMNQLVLFLRQTIQTGVTITYRENPALSIDWVVQGI